MIDLEAIRQRNEKRKRNYGESQQRADSDLWTVGAEDDIDDLIEEVERQGDQIQKLLSGAAVSVNVPPVPENVYMEVIRRLQEEILRTNLARQGVLRPSVRGT